MSASFVKPQRLREGDTVAILSPSWGGPGTFPQVYELGVRNLIENFGVAVKEYPTTRADADYLYHNPQKRAEDVNMAFADPEVKAIIASIGGDDSVRILPFIDIDVVRANPKIIMGFSDTTTLTTYLNQLGLVTFYGTSIMLGFACMQHLPASHGAHIKQVLMQPSPTHTYQPYEQWAVESQRWEDTPYDGQVMLTPNVDGWRWLQGESVAQGKLFGGCIEVLEFMKSTRFWPQPDFWHDKILFFETSEDKPSPDLVRWMLRNYGMQGVFDKISALLFARPYGYTDEEKEELEEQIIKVVSTEFGRADLPVVANMDFGHKMPQLVMPLGVTAEVDCARRTVRLVESAVV